MQKIIFGIGGLIIGLIIGFIGANQLNKNSNLEPTVSETQPDAPFQNQQIHGADIKEKQPGGITNDVQKILDRAKDEPDNATAQIEAGDMYAQIGRFPESIAFYEKANRAKPNDFQSNVKLANAYFDTKQFEKASEFYEKALQINPSDTGARTDLGITFVERANPDYDRAIKEFETSLKNDPQHEPTLYNLSIAYFKKGDIERSQAYLKQLEQAKPDSKLIEKLKNILNDRQE